MKIYSKRLLLVPLGPEYILSTHKYAILLNDKHIGAVSIYIDKDKADHK